MSVLINTKENGRRIVIYLIYGCASRIRWNLCFCLKNVVNWYDSTSKKIFIFIAELQSGYACRKL